VKIIASALTIGSGGSGGREGPIAQIGAGFGSLLGNLLHLRPASNSRRRTVLDLGQPAESNWGGVTADLLAERESGEGGEFADRSERTHASLSLATNYSSAQRIAAIKSLTCGKTLL
jgi:hypothetical protein